MSRCLNTTADFCFAPALLQGRGSCSFGGGGLECGGECGGTSRSQETSASRRLVLYDAQRRTSWEMCRVPLANAGGHKN